MYNFHKKELVLVPLFQILFSATTFVTILSITLKIKCRKILEYDKILEKTNTSNKNITSLSKTILPKMNQKIFSPKCREEESNCNFQFKVTVTFANFAQSN